MNGVQINKFLNKIIVPIQETFEKFKWTWSGSSSPNYQPSAKQIQMEFNKLYNELMSDSRITEVGGNRLVVRKFINDGEILSIEFLLSLGAVYKHNENDEEESDFEFLLDEDEDEDEECSY